MNKSKCFNVVTSLYAYICVYTCLSLTYGTQKSVFIHPYHKYLACYSHGARWYSEQRWSSAGLLPSGGEKKCNRPQKIATQILRYLWRRMFQLNEKRTAERAVRACEPTGSWDIYTMDTELAEHAVNCPKQGDISKDAAHTQMAQNCSWWVRHYHTASTLSSSFDWNQFCITDTRQQLWERFSDNFVF